MDHHLLVQSVMNLLANLLHAVPSVTVNCYAAVLSNIMHVVSAGLAAVVHPKTLQLCHCT